MVSAANYSDTVTIPSGKKITYTIVASVNAAAAGSLTHSAYITPPATVTDAVLGNNTATDTDAQPTADLSVTKTDMVVTYVPGGTVTYTIVVTNLGPSAVTSAAFTDNIPAQITTWTWTCVPELGATCLVGPWVGAVNFTDTVNIPVGRRITYTAVATINGAAVGPMVNTASITPPAAVPDTNMVNNAATDIDTP